MMRGVYLFFILTVLIGLAPNVQAAEVAVRTGTHAQYARLVFDWQEPVTYSLKQEDQSLLITFSKAATLNTARAEANPVPNITGLQVDSTDPLTTTVNIASGATIRDFKVGEKVIIDVYNPPTGATASTSFTVGQTQEPPPQAEKQEEEPTPAPQEEAEAKEEVEPAPEESAQEPAPEAEVTQEPPPPPQLTAKGDPTIIAISSTQSFGMTAFENAGNLWLVNDKTDILITPQVSGPNATALDNLKESFAENAKIYHTPKAQDLDIRGQGGGVLWRILLNKDLDNQNPPIEPVRKDVREDEIRGGKLMWPLATAREVVNMVDPYTGEKIIAVTVEDSKDYAGPAREFVDFDVLHSPVGLAIVPKIDDLKVQIVRGGVEISAPGGLALIASKFVEQAKRIQNRIQATKSSDQTADSRRVYDFQNWLLGGPKEIQRNRNEILESLKDLEQSARVEALLSMGKMYLANALGPEAIGALSYAQLEMPALATSPEFLALRGAARALAGHNADAFSDLSQDDLKPLNEIQIWRSYVLANLGDWQQAVEVKPKNLDPVYDYPTRLRHNVALNLAEIALRNGEIEQGEKMLSLVAQDEKALPIYDKAALNYLRGEAARQQGNIEETKKLWDPLTTGEDDLYRSKAGLAVTRLLMEENELTNGQAIDRLERLRYSWRGDELEAQTNFWLGKTYFENGEHIKGLKIMRDAASYVPNTNLSQRIAENMSSVFTDLFLNPESLKRVAPVEAAALYDQFSELLPTDDTGDTVVAKLADHLAGADMFTRAGNLLSTQLARVDGKKAYDFGTRLAAIRLLDREPSQAVNALNTAAQALETLPEEMRTDDRYREISLLRARATSLQGRPDQALAMLEKLENSPDTNRLRADIAWESNYWDDAAEALGDVILDQNLSLTRPLEDANADLILRRAVALNLASDRVALANMREKYTDAMSQTDKGKIFEVITRPRQSAMLSDRETMLSIVSEIELFSDFLNSYKEVTAN